MGPLSFAEQIITQTWKGGSKKKVCNKISSITKFKVHCNVQAAS